MLTVPVDDGAGGTSLDLLTTTDAVGAEPWDDPARFWQGMTQAVADVSRPVAALNLTALRFNALDMMVRSSGVPIRVASKSVRVREVVDATLALPGYRGILAFTLPEALWLADQGHDDIVVAYPTVDRAALRALAAGPRERVTIMADSVEHLELAGGAVREAGGGPIRICLDVDAGWWPLGGRLKIGARRSPVRTPEHAALLARAVVAREQLQLDGLMSYEAHIAGVGDRPPGRPLMGAAIQVMQRASARELAGRRAAVVAAVRAVAPLRFVNGGGTGSVERTAAEAAVTEVAAGSGLFAPALFDAYSAFTPRPAAFSRCRWSAGPRPASPPRSAAATSPPAPPAATACPAPCSRPGCASATACGSATPRPARCASASPRCT